MEWYYAQRGAQQPQGPLGEEQFQELVRSGAIQVDTLVWRSGMADWAPYGSIAPAARPAPIAASATDFLSASPAGDLSSGAQAAEPGAAGQTADVSAPAVVSAAPAPAVAPVVGQLYCTECGRAYFASDLAQYGWRRVCPLCREVFLQKARGSVSAPGAMEYAGFWVRFVAKLIDWVLLWIVGSLVQFLFFRGFGQSLERMTDAQDFAQVFNALALGSIVGLLIGATYSTVFVGRYGATPGKMALGLKIVAANGGAVSYGRALGRFFGEMLSQLTCYIGYIIAGFDDEKRALHDYLCSTRVIRS